MFAVMCTFKFLFTSSFAEIVIPFGAVAVQPQTLIAQFGETQLQAINSINIKHITALLLKLKKKEVEWSVFSIFIILWYNTVITNMEEKSVVILPTRNVSSSFLYSNPFLCIYQTKFVPVRISASHAQPLQGRWWQNREHFLHRFTHLLYLSLEKLSNIHRLFFFKLSMSSTGIILLPVFWYFFLSGMEPQLTLWARHLSNQSSACKVLGENRKRKGRTNHEGERGDRSTSAGFLLAKSLPCPPPPLVLSHFSPSVLSAHPSLTLPRW